MTLNVYVLISAINLLTLIRVYHYIWEVVRNMIRTEMNRMGPQLACTCQDSAAEINQLPQTISRYGRVYHYRTSQTVCGDNGYSGASSERVHRVDDLQSTSILSQSESSYILSTPTSPQPLPPPPPPMPTAVQLPPSPDYPAPSGPHCTVVAVNRMPITMDLLRTVVLQPISESPKKIKRPKGVAKPMPVVENTCSAELPPSAGPLIAVPELSLTVNDKYLY